VVDETRPRLLEAFGGRPWCAALLDTARAAVDFDRDGYASLLGGGDCAPFDGRAHPSAREIPGNGIDDNCMFGDAERSASVSEPWVPAREPSPLDVVLITVDTLRADHLGVYSAAHRAPLRANSPNLDRWARHATVFERAYTPGAWTSITLAALMHGLYPRRLEWKRYYETTRSLVVRKRQLAGLVKGDRAERMFPIAFGDPHWSLAQRLQRRGMKTAAVVDDGYTEMLQAGTGLERGFGTYRDVDLQPARTRNDEGAVDLALDFVRKVPEQTRFFLWLHLFGPHGPDQRHSDVPFFGTAPADLYDHEIAFTDKQLERLLPVLEARKHPVAVLFTSDHGEILYGTMRYHGHMLDEGSIHIPLIAKVPGWPTGRVQSPVNLIDLMPTILSLTRTPWLAPLDGIDLAPLAKGKSPAPRVLLTDTWKFQRTFTDDPEEKILDLVAGYDGDRKVLFDRIRQQWSAYPTAREGLPEAATTQTPSNELQRAIRAYLEDTGGELRIGD
jgi:arylsulfatase A-like enzyme